jgi:hypothetical protein
MAERKVVTRPSTSTTVLKEPGVKKQTQGAPMFYKDNYMWMGIGAAIVALGFLLLSGGKNPDPNQFDPGLVYSTTRITIAPILILAGLVVEIYAIFKRPKTQQ